MEVKQRVLRAPTMSELEIMLDLVTSEYGPSSDLKHLASLINKHFNVKCTDDDIAEMHALLWEEKDIVFQVKNLKIEY